MRRQVAARVGLSQALVHARSARGAAQDCAHRRREASPRGQVQRGAPRVVGDMHRRTAGEQHLDDAADVRGLLGRIERNRGSVRRRRPRLRGRLKLGLGSARVVQRAPPLRVLVGSAGAELDERRTRDHATGPRCGDQRRRVVPKKPTAAVVHGRAVLRHEAPHLDRVAALRGAVQQQTKLLQPLVAHLVVAASHPQQRRRPPAAARRPAAARDAGTTARWLAMRGLLEPDELELGGAGACGRGGDVAVVVEEEAPRIRTEEP
mmetsp:Transcript_519/g.1461  ORF Transcript_519/g.1461 Transcript_519/m.1461 type:complete len:263 (+) Transcript_519:1255-2043(+)